MIVCMKQIMRKSHAQKQQNSSQHAGVRNYGKPFAHFAATKSFRHTRHTTKPLRYDPPTDISTQLSSKGGNREHRYTFLGIRKK